MSEGDEVNDERERVRGGRPVEDNSLGRLLALSDGVFAIAMTLLALDLKVPDLGKDHSDLHLRTQLAHNSGSYLSFLVSFYVVAGLWIRHRRVMRSVVKVHPDLIRDTLFLLLVVTAMPFLASLLGTYGSIPFALALYGATNALAVVIQLMLNRDVRRLNLADEGAVLPDAVHSWHSWLNLGVFLLCIPAGYVVGRHGPYALLLLSIPSWEARVRFLMRRRWWPGRRSADAEGAAP